jgi:hypothetical protein
MTNAKASMDSAQEYLEKIQAAVSEMRDKKNEVLDQVRATFFQISEDLEGRREEL